MNWPTLTTHALAIGAWVLFVEWEIRENARQIKANGSADTLHQLFHKRRTVIRVVVALVLGLGANIPLDFTQGPYVATVGAMGLLVFFPAYFSRSFNPRLNMARQLAYIERFEVSFDPLAAEFPDRFIANQARAKYPDSEALQRLWAANRLHLLLNCLLIAGIVVESAVLAWLFVK